MTMTISGSGTITGISQGGLNDNIITQSELANTGVAGNGPAFGVNRTANQTGITGSTNTKIQFNNELFDTANCFDTSTYRFTPTVAGYYLITVSGYIQGTGGTYMSVSIYKNGSVYHNGNTMSATAAEVITTSTAIVYLNGSTDYIEGYMYASISSGTATVAASSGTKMTGALVRAA